MATASDDSDVDDIPEVEYSINPYMYEPEVLSDTDTDENDSSDSDTGDDVETQVEYRHPGEEAHLLENTNWCLCSKCMLMTNQEENICCHSQSILEEKSEECSSTCITSHDGFIAKCLNIHVLETSFYEYVQENGRLSENDQIRIVYRHIAYRRFINRKILPSCVVSMIRKTFPSDAYTGLKYPQS
ncbi:hypothetical protein ACJMK2_011908 [Sinanodonta woodiana]|uniref:P2X purinoreceptor 7 intracellular domain-containing protein n=1 Tax=Sinanodonta woodiana TaxID=1069815 RepID=A0ABD3V7N3_SINWO